MRVVGERGAPGVQHRDEADAGAEVPGIGRDREHGLGRGFEQQVVDHGLVLIGDIGIAAGSVYTTWKYGTGNNSASRSASHSLAAAPWHLGQCRLRQEL